MNYILHLYTGDVKEMASFPAMENGCQVLYDYRREYV